MRTLLYKIIYKIRFREFSMIFGFVPMFQYPDFSDALAEQRMVDARLEELATHYRMTDQNEQAATGELRMAGVSGDPEKFVSARDNLVWYRDAVQRAKKSFWYAYGLAKKAGFPMRDKYTDYLPSPWR